MDENKVAAILVLLLSSTAGVVLLNDLANGTAATTDPQFSQYFTLILLGIQVAWIASVVVVLLGEQLPETAVRTCLLISTVSLASVVLTLTISGDPSDRHLVPKFFNRSGHLSWRCGSGSSSYVSVSCTEELCCHNSDCYMLPATSSNNFTVVCVQSIGYSAVSAGASLRLGSYALLSMVSCAIFAVVRTYY